MQENKKFKYNLKNVPFLNDRQHHIRYFQHSTRVKKVYS